MSPMFPDFSSDSDKLKELLQDLSQLQPTIEGCKALLNDKKNKDAPAKVLSLLEACGNCGSELNTNNGGNVFFPLLVLELLEEILANGDNAKLGKQATAICKKALSMISCNEVTAEENKVVLAAYLPKLIGCVEKQPGKGSWKIKVIALELLADNNLLTTMSTVIPKVLQSHMAQLVGVLVACSKEVRSEIKNFAGQILEEVGLLVKCNEIKNVSDKLVNCLKNFGNMKLAAETLYAIANTTFLSYVDAASFALLFPIVSRAMKEKDFTAKKNGLMIIGAAVVLIEDPSILDSYLDTMLPLLKDLSCDPTFELRREATKSLGSLGRFLPKLTEQDLIPWCLHSLEAGGKPAQAGKDVHDFQNERTGGATALTEILVATKDKSMLERLLKKYVKVRCLNPPSEKGATGGKFKPLKSDDKSKNSPEQRAGAFELLELLCKTDVFERLGCDLCIYWILLGLRDESQLVYEAALSAGKALILNFGGPNVDSLVLPIADAVLSFEGENRNGKPATSPKAMAITLFRELVEKTAEFRQYGTDLWSMTNCSERTKRAFLTLLQISRVDPDPELRRQSNKTLSEQYSTLSRSKKECEEYFYGTLKMILAESEDSESAKTNPLLSNKRKMADLCLKDQIKEKKDTGFDQSKYDGIDAKSMNVLAETNWSELNWLTEEELKPLNNSNNPRLSVASLEAEDTNEGDDNDNGSGGKSTPWKDLENMTRSELNKMTSIQGNELAIRMVVYSVLESLTYQNCMKQIKNKLTGLIPGNMEEMEKMLKEQVYVNYHPKELRVLKNPEEILCRVENLIMMYGGGHKLLQNTTFELRKGKRYGVVGRNGTGKTTLMNLVASNSVPGIPPTMTSTHVKPEVLDDHMQTKCLKFMEITNPEIKEIKVLEDVLDKVEFPRDLWNVTIGELSGGWRMRLLIAGAMMRKSDVLLLDEPTNHLDTKAVQWLCDYLISLTGSAIMVISHDPIFLNRVCTNIINYNSGKLVYYEGNFDAFTQRLGINANDAEALLAGQVAVSEKGVERGGTGPGIDDARKNGAAAPNTPREDADGNEIKAVGRSSQTGSENGKVDRNGSPSPTGKKDRTNTDMTDSTEASSADSKKDETPHATGSGAGSASDRKAKIVFPIAGKVKGLTSLAKPVLEIENLTYAYNAEKGDVIKGVSAKITMNSRINIKGVNGAGKTTFMNLICGEVHPNASACPQKGSVNRHRNCRLAYMAQQHMHHMSDFMNSSPYIYIQKRYQNGYDGALQERLTTPANEEELEERKAKAKKFGKYGCMLKNLVGRQMRGKEPYYEAQWEGLTDTSKNSWINMEDLRKLGCESFALAYDDRAAAVEGGVSDRPLSQREIVKHLEQFGITEELALNRTIGMFSAGQKSKVSLAAAFWVRPHLVALDEPTNYIDMETLDALVIALQRFKGGVITISHSQDFVDRVCDETWFLEGGSMTVTKKDGKK